MNISEFLRKVVIAWAVPSLVVAQLSAQTFGAPPAPGVSKTGMKAVSSDPSLVTRHAPASTVALRVFKRLLLVGLSFLKMDNLLIHRLKKEKPINLQQIKARVFSGKRQMKMLFIKGLMLESRLLPSEPALAQISSIKQQLRSLGEDHQQKSLEIAALSGSSATIGSGGNATTKAAYLSRLAPDRDSLIGVLATATEFFEPPVETATEAYPIKTLSEQF